uniref:Uncharacterized protein n=1 Tax=Glossina austeni TaxID=7395 RepID=A0A1A9VWR0_GLOAU
MSRMDSGKALASYAVFILILYMIVRGKVIRHPNMATEALQLSLSALQTISRRCRLEDHHDHQGQDITKNLGSMFTSAWAICPVHYSRRAKRYCKRRMASDMKAF